MPDESIYAGRAINFFKSNQLSTIDQSPLFFYLTDVFYNLFGVNLFGARFLALFFGYILSIPLIFLIARKLYNNKVAIISAFLFTFSSLYLKIITGVPDESMVFFSLLSIYFFIKTIKDNNKFIILSLFFLGIAILLKPVALLLFVSYLIFLIYLSYKNKETRFFSKDKIKNYLIAILILIITLMPIFTYNYLFYKDQHKTDILVNRFLELNIQDYAQLGGASRGLHLSDLPQGIISILTRLLQWEPLLFLFFLGGLFLLIYKRDKWAYFLALCLLPLFLFFITTETSTVHLTIFIPIMAIFASNFILFLSDHLNKLIKKQTLKYFLIIFIIVSLLLSLNIIFSSSNFEALRSYTTSNIPQDSLVVVDSRIYTGFTAFLFNDRHYLDAQLFSQAIDKVKGLPNKQQIPTYFVECLSDDCGWATVKENPEFNQSMEDLVTFFNKNSYNKVTFNQEPEPYYRVYISNFEFNPAILQLADSTHYFYYNPVAWKNPNKFDIYKINTTFDSLLQKVSFLILYLTIFISLLLPILIIYLISKENKDVY
ncbi:MAG: glycosyltransferase family 39 protein, partial [Candidatus Woesearchaeota archaeon]|nr:glycosyltransferase family 39 protein [Candidatus Woesearchaeota archaeon]